MRRGFFAKSGFVNKSRCAERTAFAGMSLDIVFCFFRRGSGRARMCSLILRPGSYIGHVDRFEAHRPGG